MRVWNHQKGDGCPVTTIPVTQEEWIAFLNGSAYRYVDLSGTDWWVTDLDFHDDASPSPIRSLGEAFIPLPTPMAVALSRRGGLHLLHRSREDAAAACVDLLDKYPNATGCEVLQHTTLGGWEVRASNAIHLLNSWRAHPNDVAFEDRPEPYDQFAEGARLPHHLCPINPSDKVNDSTIVKEEGILCFRCGNQFRSWAQIAGSTETRDWSPEAAAKDHCWLDQVMPALRQYTGFRVPDAELQHAWKRLVMDVIRGESEGEPDTPLERMMTTRIGIIRSPDGNWVTGDGIPVDVATVRNSVTKLIPGCKFQIKTADKDGNMVWKAHNNNDLITRYVTNSATLQRGIPLIRHLDRRPLLRPDTHGHHVVDLMTEHAKAALHGHKIKTVTGIDADWTTAPAMFQTHFPGIDWKAVNITLCAIIHASRNAGQPVQAVFTGPTGSGKSTTAMLAAEMVGGRASVITTSLGDKMDEALASELRRRPGILLLDEATKSPRLWVERLIQLYSPIVTRQPYVGTLQAHIESPLILTGPSFPDMWAKNAQFCRRVVLYNLTSRVHWESLLGRGKRAYIDSVPGFREACDRYVEAMVQWVEERNGYWRDDLIHWGASAGESVLVEDGESVLSEEIRHWIYRLIEAGTYGNGRYTSRYCFRPQDIGAVRDAWLAISDDDDGDGLFRSERIAETDFRDMFKLSEPLTVRIHRRGKILSVEVSDRAAFESLARNQEEQNP